MAPGALCSSVDERAPHRVEAQFLDAILLVGGAADEVVEPLLVEPVFASAQLSQGLPAEFLGLDGHSEGLELHDVAQPRAPHPRPVGLQPADRFGPRDRALGETVAGYAERPEPESNSSRALKVEALPSRLVPRPGPKAICMGRIDRIDRATGRADPCIAPELA